MFKFVAVFALLVVILWGCSDQMNKTGYDLLLPGDLVSARKISIDKSLIKAYTVTDDSLRTNKPEYNLLGVYNDPVFGKTTANFAAQFRLKKYYDSTNATVDSLTLKLLYIETTGDTITPQTLRAYELNSDLNAEAIYYQYEDLKSKAKNEMLAEINYVPKAFKLYWDSIHPGAGSTKKTPRDTVIHEIKFKLPLSLGQKLMAFKMPVVKPSEDNNVNDIFVPYFKGLFVEAGNLNQGGSIMRIRTLAQASVMKLYYHHPNDSATVTKPVKDSVTYVMNTAAARTSHFEHNYSTDITANLDKLNQQDSLLYLQTAGGLSNKIYIPSLNNWKDSVGCAINKAELIFQVQKNLIDTLLSPAPEKLILTLLGKDKYGKEMIVDSLGRYFYPTDLSLSQAYYGGTYNKADGTYRFNLAKHLQEIIKRTKGKDTNYGFYLTTDNKNAIFRRLVLKGSSSIHFNITYTKVK